MVHREVNINSNNYAHITPESRSPGKYHPALTAARSRGHRSACGERRQHWRDSPVGRDSPGVCRVAIASYTRIFYLRVRVIGH